jgi:hypothetical protein
MKHESEVHKMKYADIIKKFTDAVAEYISKGYVIYPKTMHGVETREIVKVDLTNGSEYVRIFLQEDSKEDFDPVDSFSWFYGEIIRFAVGMIKNPNDLCIFNSEIEKILSEDYYKIGKDFYGSEEECRKQQRKQNERHSARYVRKEYKVFQESAKAAVLPFVRRQYMCKTAKLSDIEKVVKEQGKYWAYVKKRRYELKRKNSAA